MGRQSRFWFLCLASFLLLSFLTVPSFGLGSLDREVDLMSSTTGSSGRDINLFPDGDSQILPVIALNPTMPTNLAVSFRGSVDALPEEAGYWPLALQSLDGGYTWAISHVPRAGPLSTFVTGYASAIAFDGFGNVYCAGSGYEQGWDWPRTWSVWSAKSVDGGLTYDVPVMIDWGAGEMWNYPFFEGNYGLSMAVDKRIEGTGSGYIYVAWTKEADVDGDRSPDIYHIFFSRSIDGGASFSDPVQIGDSDNWPSEGAQVAVGPDGEVYVSWINWALQNPRVFLDKSTDFGASFGTDIEVLSFVNVPELAYIGAVNSGISMDVDTSGGVYNGRIYIVYFADPASATDLSDVFLISSADGGSSWSAPVAVNDDGTSNDQFFADLDVDPMGNVHIAWYDRRLDVGNEFVDVFSSESSDGGFTLSENVRVTDVSSPTNGNFYQSLDLVSSGEWTYHIWTDARNGNDGVNDDIFIDVPYQEHDLVVTVEAPASLRSGDSASLDAQVWNFGLGNETLVRLEILINGTLVDSVVIPELAIGSSYSLSYVWTPIEGAYYNITAYAPQASGETILGNNVASGFTWVQYYISTYRLHEWIGAGDAMEWHSNDANWLFTLPFDFPFFGKNYSSIYVSSNGLISFLGPDDEDIDFPTRLADRLAIAPAWYNWVTYVPYDIYIQQNSTQVVVRWYVRNAYGEGGEVNFEAILNVNGVIRFNYGAHVSVYCHPTIGVSNGKGDYITWHVNNLNYINSIEFKPWWMGYLHDVSVIDVASSRTVVGRSYSTSIDVIVQNEGNVTETFDLTVYANATVIGSQTGITLGAASSTVLSLTWATDFFAKGNYILSAYVSSVLGETDIADNIGAGDSVAVVTPGDVNADRVVNVLDTAGLSAHWFPGPPIGPQGYAPNFDINGDGKVDLTDAAIVSAYWTGPPKGPLAP